VLPQVIITGRARAGKDTVGRRLVQRHGYRRTAFADELKREVVAAFKPGGATLAQFYDEQSKTTPSAALRLDRCLDPNFVKVALPLLESEDQRLLNDATLVARALYPDTLPAALESKTHFTLAERLRLERLPRRIAQIWGTEYRRQSRYGQDSYWVDFVERELTRRPQELHCICDGRFANETAWAKSRRILRIHVQNPFVDAEPTTHSSEKIPEPDAETIVVHNDPSKGLAPLWQQIDQAITSVAPGARSARLSQA
jgi:hypothetical protein